MRAISAGPQRDKKKDENAEDWKVRSVLSGGRSFLRETCDVQNSQVEHYVHVCLSALPGQKHM